MVIHLKRFENSRRSSGKLTNSISIILQNMRQPHSTTVFTSTLFMIIKEAVEAGTELQTDILLRQE